MSLSATRSPIICSRRKTARWSSSTTQPTQIRSIRSMDQDLLVDRVVHLARFGVLYRLPVVLSTVNVSTGRNQPTIAPLQDVR